MPPATRSSAPKKRGGKVSRKPIRKSALRHQAKGVRTREAILARAVDIASALST